MCANAVCQIKNDSLFETYMKYLLKSIYNFKKNISFPQLDVIATSRIMTIIQRGVNFSEN